MTEASKPTVDLATLINQGAVEPPPQQLSQQDKEALADAGTVFTVNSIQYGDDGEFGPYWQFDVSIGGERATFRLSDNDNRNAFIQSLAAATALQSISGVRLRAIGTRGGNKFLTVEAAQ